MAGTFVYAGMRKTFGEDGTPDKPIGHVFNFVSDADDASIPPVDLLRGGICTGMKVNMGDADSLTPVLSDMDGDALGIAGAEVTTSGQILPTDSKFLNLVGPTTIDLGSSNTEKAAAGSIIIFLI